MMGTGATSFNGLQIRKELDGTMELSQPEKIDKLEAPETEKEFASRRALAQYIGVNVRPEVCTPVQLIAPGNSPTTEAEFKSLRKTITFLQNTRGQGLTYVRLDLPTTRLVLLTDASLANASGMKSQLGYVLLMDDAGGNCNIVHYGSNRCQRIARSVMAAEVQALVLGFDYAYVVRDLIEESMGRRLQLEALVDSKALFNVIAKDASTAERRLQIDVLALRQSYETGELCRIGWIPGVNNPADSLTKPIPTETSPLLLIMKTNRFKIEPQG